MNNEVNFSYIKSNEDDNRIEDSLKYYREIDIENDNYKYNSNKKRNDEIEKRIKLIEKRNNIHGINLYGGMGLDSVLSDVKLLRLEELEYMKQHPDLYEYKPIPNYVDLSNNIH